MKIVFFGTPEFAVATLDAIYHAGHDIAAVVTAPDKPAGRGQQLAISAVKQYALDHHLPILQPEKLKNPDFLAELAQLAADVFVVVAFRMLPEAVFAMPPKGTFNIHASLLPNYRGAAPIHHAIMNGETKSGVTSFFINQNIDTGDIIAQTEVEIGADEDTGSLYNRLMIEGGKLAVHTLQLIENENVTTIKQQHIPLEEIKLAPKIFKEDTLIDWNQSAVQIFNKIRGLSPVPTAYTRIKNNNGEIFTLKCFKASILPENSSKPAGTMTLDAAKRLIIHTKTSQISLEIVQFQGKSKMKITDFLAGFRPEKYTLFLF